MLIVQNGKRVDDHGRRETAEVSTLVSSARRGLVEVHTSPGQRTPDITTLDQCSLIPDLEVLLMPGDRLRRTLRQDSRGLFHSRCIVTSLVSLSPGELTGAQKFCLSKINGSSLAVDQLQPSTYETNKI